MLKHYESLDTNNKLVWNLRDIGHTMRHTSEGKGSQKRILTILHESGSMTQRELTERLGVQPGSASEVIGKLENAELLMRTPNTSDGRTTDVSLTEEGKAQAEKVTDHRKQWHKAMFSCLSDEEKMTFLFLLEKVNTDWEQRYRDNKPEHNNGKCHKDHKNHCNDHGRRSHHRKIHIDETGE